MIKSKTLTIIFILFYSIANSQNEISLKIIPQNTIHPDLPSLPLEFEYKLGKYAIEYNHAFKTEIFGTYDDFRENIKYFRSRVGFKYYHRDWKVKQFIGVNLSYTPISFQKHNDYYNFQNDYYHYDTSDIFIQQYKIALLYGFKFPIYIITDIEIVSGIGVKYQTVKHQTAGLNLVGNYDELPGFDTLNENPGNHVVPYILMNIKFNFRIYNSKKKTEKTIKD